LVEHPVALYVLQDTRERLPLSLAAKSRFPETETAAGRDWFECGAYYDPPEGLGWCYFDEAFVELDHLTKQVGSIKR
jgi:hypothetical protein